MHPLNSRGPVNSPPFASLRSAPRSDAMSSSSTGIAVRSRARRGARTALARGCDRRSAAEPPGARRPATAIAGAMPPPASISPPRRSAAMNSRSGNPSGRCRRPEAGERRRADRPCGRPAGSRGRVAEPAVTSRTSAAMASGRRADSRRGRPAHRRSRLGGGAKGGEVASRQLGERGRVIVLRPLAGSSRAARTSTAAPSPGPSMGCRSRPPRRCARGVALHRDARARGASRSWARERGPPLERRPRSLQGRPERRRRCRAGQASGGRCGPSGARKAGRIQGRSSVAIRCAVFASPKADDGALLGAGGLDVGEREIGMAGADREAPGAQLLSLGAADRAKDVGGVAGAAGR